MSKEYSWIIVAYPRGEGEIVLSQCQQWYSSKRQSIDSLKRVLYRGVDIPDHWGGPCYYILSRSSYNKHD